MMYGMHCCSDSFSACIKLSGSSGCVLLTGNDWSSKGIAWESDVDEKFKPPNFNPPTETNIGPGGFMLPNHTNEEFIVWMRTAGLPTFKKLHRIIKNSVLAAGSIMNITIMNSMCVFVVSIFVCVVFFCFVLGLCVF